ncbi:26S proteasome non-ATPase regulatory subunit 10-like [Actinia tenebrosa]|uniref:26S proteasome non-ATPase regulatory subunit 10-like n=1 Tax=Actinia tenebrosa TaxID=6105 RepID=A0A6P8HU67_ACTTE|nr:26S proteasome non-ATPase regulatory subunit 10-like [Actinia tenebrosa]
MADKQTEKKSGSSHLKRFLKDLKLFKGTSSNVEELQGRLLAVVCSRPVSLSEVERLILKGAPVNSRSELWQDYTALHFACRNDDIPTVQLLIQYGADVNARGDDGSTPLHAALSGSREPQCNLIKLLHKNGANLNALNFRGETPLHLAATSQSTSSATTLISLGADPFISTYQYQYESATSRMACPIGKMGRPIGHCLTSGRLQLILLFLQHGDSFEDYKTSTLFYAYSRSMNLEIVKLLVEAGLRVPQDIFRREDMSLSFEKWPDSFIEWLTGPRSLQLQSMRTIRNCVGNRNLGRIAELSLPTKLKDRLMFKFEGIGVKNDSNCCVDKGVGKTSRGMYFFNIYDHAIPCRCISS